MRQGCKREGGNKWKEGGEGGSLIFSERHPPIAVNLNCCKLTDCQLRNLFHRSHLSIPVPQMIDFTRTHDAAGSTWGFLGLGSGSRQVQ
jgi:hypothetical protein